MSSLRPSKWFNRTITFARLASRTASGDGVYLSQSTASARIEANESQPAGGDDVADTVIFTETELTPGDRVWLPGASTASIDTSRLVARALPRYALDGTLVFYRVEL